MKPPFSACTDAMPAPALLSPEDEREILLRNPKHPHHILKQFVNDTMCGWRHLSGPELEQGLHGLFAEMDEQTREATPWPGPGRSQKLNFVREQCEVAYKRAFRKKFGFDFDDTYVLSKFQQHLRSGGFASV